MSTWIVKMGGVPKWRAVCSECKVLDPVPESSMMAASRIARFHAQMSGHGPVDPFCESVVMGSCTGMGSQTWIEQTDSAADWQARCPTCGLLGLFKVRADALSEAAGHRCTTAPYSAQLKPPAHPYDQCTCGHDRSMHFGSPFCQGGCPCNGFSAATEPVGRWCACGHEEVIHLIDVGPHGTRCAKKNCPCVEFLAASPPEFPAATEPVFYGMGIAEELMRQQMSQPKPTEDCWSCRGRRACDVCGGCNELD